MLRLLYHLYELRLRRQIRELPVPDHVGIILDGNRRFARKRGLDDPCKVYFLGAEKLDDVLSWCVELGIQAVTVWVCSIDNLKRPPDQVAAILAAVEAKIAALTVDPFVHRRRIRLKAAGRLDLLPPSTIRIIRCAEEATSDYDAVTVTFAVAYGGQEEIADAVRDLIHSNVRKGVDLDDLVEAITPEEIEKRLYTTGLPDPDLIIRTSGEVRLSGFLLWQSARSELYFSDVNWPEYRKVDFLRAVRSYQQRTRRFGL